MCGILYGVIVDAIDDYMRTRCSSQTSKQCMGLRAAGFQGGDWKWESFSVTVECKGKS